MNEDYFLEARYEDQNGSDVDLDDYDPDVIECEECEEKFLSVREYDGHTCSLTA